MNITFIGGGNMAAALIGGLLNKGFDAARLSVVEISDENRTKLHTQFGINVYAMLNYESVADSEIIMLAVKPQQIAELAASLGPLLNGQVVVSIAAGIRLDDLARWLGGYGNLVRVMPNTPALTRAGVSGLFAMPGVSEARRKQVNDILAAVGTTLWLDNESQMDAITGVSGSGPAYVFYFMEALEEAALGLGFDAKQAKQLSYDTFYGAVKLAMESPDSTSVLRNRVTSKGGTTEKALQAMEEAQIKSRIIDAVNAAAERSRELGEILSKQ